MILDRKSYNDVSSFGTDLWCQTLPEYDFKLLYSWIDFYVYINL